ncbi:glycosyltransferase family 4 protein [Candidatus Altiarchaeota archaeon]
MEEKIFISTFPMLTAENPYQNLLIEHLAGCGVENVKEKVFLFDALKRYKGKVHILHFHWLFDQVRTPKRVAKFLARVVEAKLLGYKIVWTVHNVKGHESEGWRGWMARHGLAMLADAQIAHGENVKKMIQEEYGTGDKVHVIPHANYIGFYPNTISRQEARKKLGIPEDRFVYLFFGLVRKYKGIENLIDSFEKLGGSATLVIAGNSYDEDYRREVREKVEGRKDVILRLERIPEDEVQAYFNACDTVVLPFTQITTSGSLLLALSFAKPVITVNKGGIPEIVTDEFGVLIGDDGELADALDKIRKMDVKSMGQKAYEKAGSWGWDDVARAHHKVYQELLGINRSSVSNKNP